MKTFAKTNKEVLKKEIIENYLLTKKRVPTIRELNKEIEEELLEESQIVETGIFLKNKRFPKVKDESSSSEFNKLFNRVKDSIKALNEEYFVKRENLEKEFRSCNKVFTDLNLELEDLKSEADLKLLLTNSDAFQYGITETFRSFENVDREKTTARFIGNKPTVNILRQSNVNFDSENLSLVVQARKNDIVERSSVNSIEEIKREDGTFYEEVVFTNSPSDIVDFTVNISFRERQDLNKLKLVTKAVEVGSKCAVNILYSTDGNTFVPIFESNIRIENNINNFDINKRNVTKLKVVFTKSAYDVRKGDLYGYIFSLDYIGGTSPEYNVNERSFLYLGPYEITEEDKPINFRYATVKQGTCCVIPDKSSIDFFLSKTGEEGSYKRCSFFDNGLSVVSFDASETPSIEMIGLANTDLFRSNAYGELEDDEVLLNYYVREENIDKVDEKLIKIKRLHGNSNQEAYEASDGWYFENNLYNTTFYIEETEGRYIDFGLSGTTLINGQNMSGEVFLGQGHYTISTNNYIEIPQNISTIEELSNRDSFYPYNAKYLIEGYRYGRNFVEEKIYKGVSENFGWYCSYKSDVHFSSSNEKNIFTSFKNEGNMYFKMKRSTSNNYYNKEKIVLDYNKYFSSGNKIYIKAILETDDYKVTPKIHSIQVRVI